MPRKKESADALGTIVAHVLYGAIVGGFAG
jgi:hypothetical protein